MWLKKTKYLTDSNSQTIRYFPDSINNRYRGGSPYRSDSSNNPFGTGIKIGGD